MKKQYNTPQSERIALHGEALLNNPSKITVDSSKSGPGALTNEHDYNDSWDDLDD